MGETTLTQHRTAQSVLDLAIVSNISSVDMEAMDIWEGTNVH